MPDDDGCSSLVKLTCAMTEMKELPALLTVERFPQVSYLNVRKGRLSPHGLSALAGVIAPAGLPLTTLVLDGMKLSGKKELAALFGMVCVCGLLVTLHTVWYGVCVVC